MYIYMYIYVRSNKWEILLEKKRGGAYLVELMLSPLTRTSTIYKRKKKIEAAELCDCEKDKRQLINYKNYYN